MQHQHQGLPLLPWPFRVEETALSWAPVCPAQTLWRSLGVPFTSHVAQTCVLVSVFKLSCGWQLSFMSRVLRPSQDLRGHGQQRKAGPGVLRGAAVAPSWWQVELFFHSREEQQPRSGRSDSEPQKNRWPRGSLLPFTSAATVLRV